MKFESYFNTSYIFYRHELYHELGHLVDYHLFLERNCDTVMKWKDNFLRTCKRELSMMRVLVNKSDAQLNHIVNDIEKFHDRSQKTIGELSSQVSSRFCLCQFNITKIDCFRSVVVGFFFQLNKMKYVKHFSLQIHWVSITEYQALIIVKHLVYWQHLLRLHWSQKMFNNSENQ